MKTLSCRDAGVNCDFVAQGRTDDEVLKNLAEHGKQAHNMKDADFTQEKINKFKALIHDEEEIQQSV